QAFQIPSSETEAVICAAFSFNAGVALPIATGKPTVSNIVKSFSSSPKANA
ncbi:hypothetical protein A5875_001263, partial [Enterococcus sp. 3H8_DIV0648]